MKLSPSISFLSKADFVLFPLSTLIAKPTTQSLYTMGFSFTTSVGPNAIFGFLRLFYTNPSQILESLTDFCVYFLFTQLLADSNIYTSVEYFYTGVEEGSPATSPPVAASLAKGALMASSAVAPLAVSVLLPAAVARTKKRQL